jgi:hypothetical protein
MRTEYIHASISLDTLRLEGLVRSIEVYGIHTCVHSLDTIRLEGLVRNRYVHVIQVYVINKRIY